MSKIYYLKNKFLLNWHGAMFWMPSGGHSSFGQQHLLSGFSSPLAKTSSSGVQQPEVMPPSVTSQRCLRGHTRHRSLSYTFTTSEPVTARGGNRDPATHHIVYQSGIVIHFCENYGVLRLIMQQKSTDVNFNTM